MKLNSLVFWFSIYFSTLYYSYRYPLQINSSLTSPTYSDTPISLQLGKYIILSIIIVILSPYLRFKIKTPQQKLFLIFIFSFSVFSFIKGVFLKDTDMLEISLIPIAATIISLSINHTTLNSFDVYIKFTYWIAVFSSFAQILLFYSTGRLPALAYDNSISVRFGSFLDDPNGFGAICYLLLGWLICAKGKGVHFTIQLIVTFTLLLLTQSLTAIGFIPFFLITAWIIHGRKLKHVIYSFVISLFFLIIFTQTDISITPILSNLIELKSDSIDAHLNTSTSTIFYNSSVLNFLFGMSEPINTESGWLYILLNFGVVGLIMFITPFLIMAISFLANKKNRISINRSPTVSAIFFFSLFFVFGMSNLPYLKVFPVNFLFFLFSSLIIFNILKLNEGNK